MATSNSMGEFAKRMAVIASAVKANTLKTVKRAAIAADQAVVLATPVDTGRARSNWLVTIGTPAEGEVDSFPTGLDGSSAGAAANQALEQGRNTALQYTLGAGGIFITNNVRYIIYLERGHSAQAPKGMTSRGIQAAQRELGSARLLEGV